MYMRSGDKEALERRILTERLEIPATVACVVSLLWSGGPGEANFVESGVDWLGFAAVMEETATSSALVAQGTTSFKRRVTTMMGPLSMGVHLPWAAAWHDSRPIGEIQVSQARLSGGGQKQSIMNLP